MSGDCILDQLEYMNAWRNWKEAVPPRFLWEAIYETSIMYFFKLSRLKPSLTWNKAYCDGHDAEQDRAGRRAPLLSMALFINLQRLAVCPGFESYACYYNVECFAALYYQFLYVRQWIMSMTYS